MTISLEEHVARAISKERRGGWAKARAAIAAVREREDKRIPKRNYLEEDCDELDRRLAPDPAEDKRADLLGVIERLTECAKTDRGAFTRFAFPRVVERDDLLDAIRALKGNGEGR